MVTERFLIRRKFDFFYYNKRFRHETFQLFNKKGYYPFKEFLKIKKFH